MQKVKPNEDDLSSWLLPFTDMVVLLMAFFAVSYTVAVSKISESETLKDSIAKTFNSIEEKPAEPATQLNLLKENIEVMLRSENLTNQFQLTKQDDGIVLIAPSTLLFSSGSDSLTFEAKSFVKKIALLVESNTLHLQIEGHTDSTPIHNQRFSSNWELSTGRATQVVKQLIRNGISANRLSAVGFADTRPLLSAGKIQDNLQRRVVLRFFQPT